MRKTAVIILLLSVMTLRVFAEDRTVTLDEAPPKTIPERAAKLIEDAKELRQKQLQSTEASQAK